MDETYPDLNNEKILFREAARCLRIRNWITADTFGDVVNATKAVKEAKGEFRFSAEEIRGFELLMKAGLRGLYEKAEKKGYDYLPKSEKIEIELLNRAIDVLKCGLKTIKKQIKEAED